MSRQIRVTGTHMNYYHICKRELWLFAHDIRMEHSSSLVSEGRFIHENTYPQRASRYQEVQIEGIKIDFYDAKNKVVHEIKKSNRAEKAHIWQVKYYIYVLQQKGICEVTGVLEYPKLRETKKIELLPEDVPYIETTITEIQAIIASPTCPPRLAKKHCQNCSYFYFCWSGEG